VPPGKQQVDSSSKHAPTIDVPLWVEQLFGSALIQVSLGKQHASDWDQACSTGTTASAKITHKHVGESLIFPSFDPGIPICQIATLHHTQASYKIQSKKLQFSLGFSSV